MTTKKTKEHLRALGWSFSNCLWQCTAEAFKPMTLEAYTITHEKDPLPHLIIIQTFEGGNSVLFQQRDLSSYVK